MRNMRRYFLAIFLTILFSTTTFVFAQSTPHTMPNSHLVIATSDNSPIAIDRLLFAAFKNISLYSVDIITPVLREGYVRAHEGAYDGVVARYPDLHTMYENLLKVPVALEHTNVRVFAREGSAMRINGWDELSGLHVGILENRIFIPERLPKNVAITEKSTNIAVLDGLANGEYDVAVLAERDHEMLGARHRIARIGDLALLTEYLYLNKRHEALIPQLSVVLQQLFEDGTASNIFNDLPSQESNLRKTIVHILSTSIELNREDQFISTLRKRFENDMSIDWMTVNIDARRLSRGQYSMPIIASLLRADLVPKNVAAVIVSGDIALDFLKNYYSLYFRNIPVLFYGVSEGYKEIIQANEHHNFFTGIVKSIEVREMVETALSLFPDTKRLFVVNDYTFEGIHYRNTIERDLEPLKGRVHIDYNDNLSAASLLQQITELPKNGLVLVGSYFVDGNHQYYSLGEMKRLLEKNCNIPVISFYSTDLAYNAIGGKCLDYQRYGNEIAGMLQKLLAGSSVESIPVVHDSSAYNRWVFDQKQMDAFHIKQNALPAGVEIINKKPSILEYNPELFIALVFLSIVSALLITGICIFLFINRKYTMHKNKLQHELMVEKSMLEIIFNSVPEILFVKDLDRAFIRVNKKFEEHFGLSEGMIIGKMGYENKLLGAIVDDFTETEMAVIHEGRLIKVEKSIESIKGTFPVFEVIATPLLINSKISGIVGAAYDITHRKEMEEAAQAASRAKSNFLANMSHEMRTPLTAVLGLTELTLETAALDVETHANLIKVYRAGETILNLVNDILDISKIEADKLTLTPRKYDLPSLINDTITQSMLYINEKPIELVLDIKEDLPNYLYGDELRIRQILNNLLSNAFKFTHEGTVIFGIRCERDGDTVWLTAWARDTGIGMRPAAVSTLFTRYGKMEEDINRASRDRRTEGTGLGLPISKKLAEMMDGSITVESEYGKGSVFTVKLRQTYVDDELIGINAVESLKKFDYGIQRFESANMTRINLSYARVLIVDDNPTNLNVAKGLMMLYGMTIDCVTRGQQAVDAIYNKKVEYSAIFMDHMMPEMDGIEATRIIREIDTEYAQKIPIIALTANALLGNEEIFLSKGFQAFIAKPIDRVHLDAVLRQWVRDKAAEDLLPEKTITFANNRKEKKIFCDDIPGLDIDKGIEHFGFSEDTYFKVLQSYVKNTRPLLRIIHEMNKDNLDAYGVTIHGIKGSSRGIFAANVGDEAEALEKAAFAGDLNFLNANNQRFLDAINSLLTDIERTLSKSEMEQKLIQDKPDDELLAKLLTACSNYDIDEIDMVMAAIESYEYLSDDGLAVWLRENIDQGKYKNVKDKLSVFLVSTEV